MRSACSSLNAERTTRLISRALARSWPSGFSSTMRTCSVVQAGRAELRADDRKQRRAGRQVQHHGVGAAAGAALGGGRLEQPALQAGVVLGPRQVHAAVVQQRGEAVELLVARPLGAVDLAEALADQLAVAGVVALLAGDGEDASVGRQLAVAEGLEQGGQQLAPCEVAGAAEEDEVEGHGARRVGRNRSGAGRRRPRTPGRHGSRVCRAGGRRSPTRRRTPRPTPAGTAPGPVKCGTAPSPPGGASRPGSVG